MHPFRSVLSTPEPIHPLKFSEQAVSLLHYVVVSWVGELVRSQGINSMNFFNHKQNEMILEPNDLLKGVEGNFSENIIKESANLVPDLPFADEKVVSGEMLDGLDVPLEFFLIIFNVYQSRRLRSFISK